jgi:hypothetical protein
MPTRDPPPATQPAKPAPAVTTSAPAPRFFPPYRPAEYLPPGAVLPPLPGSRLRVPLIIGLVLVTTMSCADATTEPTSTEVIMLSAPAAASIRAVIDDVRLRLVGAIADDVTRSALESALSSVTNDVDAGRLASVEQQIASARAALTRADELDATDADDADRAAIELAFAAAGEIIANARLQAAGSR